MIVSHDTFMWIVTGLALLICAVWGARDVYLLFRHLSPRGRTAITDRRNYHDQVFGSLVGVVIIGLGLYGIIKYWTSR